MPSKTFEKIKRKLLLIAILAFLMLSLSFLFVTLKKNKPVKYIIAGCVNSGFRRFPARNVICLEKHNNSLIVYLTKNCCTNLSLEFEDENIVIRELNNSICRCICEGMVQIYNFEPKEISYIDWTGKIYNVKVNSSSSYANCKNVSWI